MKIKVLHVIESLRRGGAERRLLNDLRYLDGARFENYVCHLFPARDLVPEADALGIPVFCLGLKGPRQIVRGVRSLSGLIRQLRPDIVHSQLFCADVCSRLAARVGGAQKVISTIQSSCYEPSVYFSRKRRWLDLVTGRLFSHGFIAVSEFVRASTVKHLGFRPELFEIIPNSVDLEKFSRVEEGEVAALKGTLGLNSRGPLLLAVTSLVSGKGVDVLVRAMEEVLARHPRATLLLAGEGPQEGELRALARKLSIEEKVHFMGLREDVPLLLKLSDLFIFPSLSEGLPVALLEAMAAGRLCVASRIQPVEELIRDGDSGYLFEPGDAAALARGVSRALENPELGFTLARRGRLLVEERFEAAFNAGRLGEFYLRLLKAH